VPLGSDYATQACSIARTLEVIGERWTLLILRDLFMGVHRFSDLHAHLDIPRAVLAARLAALVEQGIVERRPYRADRAEIHLTAPGRELWPIVHGLVVWGDRHRPVHGGPRRLFVHAACGTPLAGAGDCPACGIAPEPAEIETRPGPGVDPARRHDRVSRALRQPHRLLTPLTVQRRS
jgi:DNA-binding HxlR family transcriptional regulator